MGCGGSGRAIAAAISEAGADVVLSNRGRRRGELASQRLGLPLIDLSAFSAANFDLIVNATSVGRASAELPFACDRLAAGTVVIDLVYASRATPLAIAAAARGARVISGHEVLLVQAMRQFEKMTGRVIPAHVMAGQIALQRGTCALARRSGPPGNRRCPSLLFHDESATTLKCKRMIYDLSHDHRVLVERVSELARGPFAARAAQYDRDAAFPGEDFQDLFRAGLLRRRSRVLTAVAASPPTMGCLRLWWMTKELAQANMSLAQLLGGPYQRTGTADGDGQ